MLTIDLLDFNRVVMHEVIKKTERNDAYIIPFNQLEDLGDEVVNTVKERLNAAVGRESRCFTMEMAKVNEGSFFDLCKDLQSKNDDEFISKSSSIASLLADTQRSRRIPGGYLILMDCTYRPTGKAAYIVIKAEQHDALAKDYITGHINVLKRIFLSPSQKLYKVGILTEREQINIDEIYPNDQFECFLFDEQINPVETLPATYFFEDFLGFSISKNAKVQTKRFYDKTKDFILKNYVDYENQDILLGALKTTVIADSALTIDPTEFGNSYIEDLDIRNRYSVEILTKFPSSFAKNTDMLMGTLKERKLSFPNKIKLSGPDLDFDSNVSFARSVEELDELSLSDGEYTIIIVKGKPNRNA